MEITEGIRKSIESLFDHLINDERFDRAGFVGESPDNKTALELVDGLVDTLSPDPFDCTSLEAGCTCWHCGQKWRRANHST